LTVEFGHFGAPFFDFVVRSCLFMVTINQEEAMALDLTVYVGEERAALVNLGSQYGSESTLKQAAKTLEGLKKYAEQLRAHGFSASDKTLLQNAHDALIAAGVSRTTALGAKKITNKTYDNAVKTGKLLRESARSIAEGVLRDVRGATDAAQRQAALTVQTTLAQTGTAPDDATLLADQLELLQKTLESTALANFLKERGGLDALTKFPEVLKSLREVGTVVTLRGTPVETETLDLIDGIIIELTRSARKAAKVLAKELGEPAINSVFELDELYATKGAK
jgi:polyhydroxyalkanoate synthesis regulator phasin